jgi:hypothetical protein
MRYLLIVLAVVAIFTVFTTVFAASASPKEVRLLPKWAWVIICLLVPGVGGILYLTAGRPKSSGPNSTGGRTVAPDDDPEFLRKLRERLNTDSDGETDLDTGFNPDKGPNG